MKVVSDRNLLKAEGREVRKRRVRREKEGKRHALQGGDCAVAAAISHTTGLPGRFSRPRKSTSFLDFSPLIEM